MSNGALSLMNGKFNFKVVIFIVSIDHRLFGTVDFALPQVS